MKNRIMPTPLRLGLLWILLIGTGCGVNLPQLRHPGFLHQQQLRATFYDPYAAVDIAPDVLGGRPHNYMQPRTLETQSQWELDQPR